MWSAPGRRQLPFARLHTHANARTHTSTRTHTDPSTRTHTDPSTRTPIRLIAPMVTALVMGTVGWSVFSSTGTTGAASTPSVAAALSSAGYRMVAADGGMFAFGGVPSYGSMGGAPLNASIVGTAVDPSTGGYWEVAADGGIFSFDSPFHGSMGGKPLNAPIVGIAASPTGGGYWEVAADGGIFSFAAPFHGSMGGSPLNSPVVGIAATPTGGGYWEVAADGGLFNFGDAAFRGSMGGRPLNAPVVGITADATTGATGAATSATAGTGPATGTGAPAAPTALICGNISLLDGPATAPPGAVSVPAGDDSALLPGYDMRANTVYWFAPGTHTLGSGEYSQIQPATGDTFVGAPGAVIDGQGISQSAFDGGASGVTVEYLTIERFEAPEGQMVVNHTGASNWSVVHDTIEDNGGAGVGLASGSVVTDDCLTHNTEYGFSSFGGSSHVVLTSDEVSYNDATGAYDHPGAGSVQCGCSGGGKFWNTVDATVTGDYVHDNGDVGIWADTDNAGFDISHNYIADNYAEGVLYEISYNALISDNTLVGNAVDAGPTVRGFPDSAIYISESGGDARVASDYAGELDVTGNVLTDNWGGVVLWENANRYCGDGPDQACTLVDPAVVTMTSCTAHLATATPTQTPDYYDACRWKTQNVTVADNTFTFTPAAVGPTCTVSTWCGFTGLFSEYGTTAPWTGWAVPLHISDSQNDHFLDNVYKGPWMFDGFDQGEAVTWTQWTAGFDDTNGSGARFDAQDQGSSYTS